jgi:hypothetical protein
MSEPLTTRDLADKSAPADPDLVENERDEVGAPEPEFDPPAARVSEPVTAEPSAEDVSADSNVQSKVPEGQEPSGGRSVDEPLLPADQSQRFTSHWEEIQASFVDQPRQAVEQADALVADLMQRLAASFSNERERLEGHWDRGDDVSTEDLRVALTRYRSFFDRLLSA